MQHITFRQKHEIAILASEKLISLIERLIPPTLLIFFFRSQVIKKKKNTVWNTLKCKTKSSQNLQTCTQLSNLTNINIPINRCMFPSGLFVLRTTETAKIPTCIPDPIPPPCSGTTITLESLHALPCSCVTTDYTGGLQSSWKMAWISHFSYTRMGCPSTALSMSFSKLP